MRLIPLAAVVLLAGFTLAGCSGGGGDDKDGDSSSTTTGSSTTSGSGAPRPNRAPLGSLDVTLPPASGLPLMANFTLNGTDPDGDALRWTLTFGDNTTTANGTTLPSSVSHDYASAGNFTALFTLMDGKTNATYNLTVAVAGAGALPDPLHFEGTLTALPYIPMVASPNGLIDSATATHEFAFTATPAVMTVTLAYGEGLFFNDVDLFITDPAGEETAAEEAGPEPPVVFESPAAGTWGIRVFAYGGEGDIDYTVDVTFS